MNPMTLLWMLFLGGGTVLIGLSLPLIQGRVGPNPWYGFRARRTLEDPRVWSPANSYRRITRRPSADCGRVRAFVATGKQAIDNPNSGRAWRAQFEVIR